jgi:hypothetical protein
MFGMLVVAKLAFSAAQLRLEMSPNVMVDDPWCLLAWIDRFKGFARFGGGTPPFSVIFVPFSS